MADRGITALMCGVEYHGSNFIIMLRQRSTLFIPQCWVTIKSVRSHYPATAKISSLVSIRCPFGTCAVYAIRFC